jgi:hypothetical protein
MNYADTANFGIESNTDQKQKRMTRLEDVTRRTDSTDKPLRALSERYALQLSNEDAMKHSMFNTCAVKVDSASHSAEAAPFDHVHAFPARTGFSKTVRPRL